MYFQLRDNKQPYTPGITFLAEHPIIDGILDEELSKQLPERKFDFRFNINIFKGSAGSNYRMAYGMDYIYLYIEAEADSFICRDRGYQNGDGFIFSLTTTNPKNSKTNEYYILGFSSQVKQEQEWAKKILWNYNGKVILSRLKDDVAFEYKAKDGKIGFELLLPWSTIYPYHPFLSEGIGFNLGFMKAYPNRKFPNIQGVLFEIPSESGPIKYKALEFEVPNHKHKNQSYLVLDKNHCYQGDKIYFKTVVLSDQASVEEFNISFYSEKDDLLTEEKFSSENLFGLNTEQYEYNTTEMAPGNYRIEWQGSNGNDYGEFSLTVLPIFDNESILGKFEFLKSKITKGSYATMQFHINEVNRQINRLKDYEDCPELINEVALILDYFEQMELGNDTISNHIGTFRRAFRSELDSSLQPYTIKIPENYDTSKKYPLLVFLHGSGRSDENMFTSHPYLSNGDFIQLAPYARGKSHFYGTINSQIDINEAIKNVIENYSIDTSNIILSGFSMGGYGVYRTFVEKPNLYKGLVIFSGLPKVGFFQKSKNGKYPNFLKRKNLEKFSGIPIFIYHGTNDLNCSYKLTKEFINKLTTAGAEVKFFFSEGTGHSPPRDEEILAKYYEWLDNLIR